jgi:hypothetical protein
MALLASAGYDHAQIPSDFPSPLWLVRSNARPSNCMRYDDQCMTDLMGLHTRRTVYIVRREGEIDGSCFFAERRQSCQLR